MRVLISLLFFLCTFSLAGQELQLNVQVTVPSQVQLQVDRQIFQTLESQITEFMNSTQWSDVTFKPKERIKGSLMLTIKKDDGGSVYEAELYIQTKRPVYGTDYETQVFSWIDKKVKFSYKEFQPLRRTTTSYTDNLSSILSYYAFMILGMDFDTFSKLGGDPYFKIAESIVNAVPNGRTGDGGWGNKTNTFNRFSLVNDIFNPSIEKARIAMYNYHRKGLDIMSTEPEAGRSNITAALKAIQSVHKDNPHSAYIFFITNAKVQELVSIYNIAPPMEKKRIYAILVDINPSMSNKIEALR